MSHAQFLTPGGFNHGGDMDDQNRYLISGYAEGVRLADGIVDIWTEKFTKGYPSVATVASISSNSADDTALGSGARSVSVIGLDDNFNLHRETINLAGLGAVNTITKFSRIYDYSVVDTGAGGEAAGRIEALVDGVLLGVISDTTIIPHNQMMGTHYTLGADRLGYIVQAAVIPSGNASGIVSFETRKLDSNLNNPPFVGGTVIPFSGPVVYDFAEPPPLDENTDIRVRGRVTAGIGDIAVMYELMICQRREGVTFPNPPIPSTP